MIFCLIKVIGIKLFADRHLTADWCLINCYYLSKSKSIISTNQIDCHFNIVFYTTTAVCCKRTLTTSSETTIYCLKRNLTHPRLWSSCALFEDVCVCCKEPTCWRNDDLLILTDDYLFKEEKKFEVRFCVKLCQMEAQPKKLMTCHFFPFKAF